MPFVIGDDGQRRFVHPTHIVAVGGLVKRQDGKVLLVYNGRRGWEFPGGQVERGEGLIEALLREIEEESGVKACVRGLAGIYSNIKEKPPTDGRVATPTIVNMDFVCEYGEGELKVSLEHREAGWFTKEEALQMVTHPLFLRRLKNMLERPQLLPIEAFTFDDQKLTIAQMDALER